MPFKFTGKLEKVEIRLGPDQLTAEKHGESEQMNMNLDMAGQ
jgi:hypothetical protein